MMSNSSVFQASNFEIILLITHSICQWFSGKKSDHRFSAKRVAIVRKDVMALTLRYLAFGSFRDVPYLKNVNKFK